jgi:hypothetical protein
MNLNLLRAAGFALIGSLAMAGVANATPPIQFGVIDAGGGALSAPLAQGNYLYVGTGVTLTTWDMTDPSQPVIANRTSSAPSPGPVRALALVGGYLYAAWNTTLDTGGITIYSISDPAHPVVVAEVDDYIDSDFKRPMGLAVNGSTVYLGDADNGLVVLDATDPLAPLYVTAIGIYEFDAMGIYGGQLMSTGTSFIGGRNVHVVDISAAQAPVEVGFTSLDEFAVLRAVLTDGYAIGVGDELMVYDVRDPANISQVFDTGIDQATQAIRAGNVLYLFGGTGVQVWDFSTPSAPALLRTVNIDVFAADQVAATPFGPLLLTHTDHGLLLGTADPLNPTLATSFDLPFGVATHGAGFDATHAYLAQEAYGLGALDLTTLALSGRYDAALPADLAQRDMEGISIDGSRAYLAAWGYGVLIADLSNPASPTALGSFEFPFADTIEAHGNLAYVASATNGGIFRILDVSDPTSPQELGELITSQTYELTVRGSYAYLVDGADFGDGGLRIVDVSDPTTPVVSSLFGTCSVALGLDVSADGNTAYVACADGGVYVVDTTDKTNPVLLGSLILAGNPILPDYNVAHAVRVAGTTAFVGHEYGVDEIDIGNPQAPVLKARHATGYFVSKLALAPDGRVFAFAQEGGTYIFAPLPDKIFGNGFD